LPRPLQENLDGTEGDALDTQKAVDAVDAEDPEASAKERARKRLVAEETQRSGAVGRDTYKLYIAAMGRVPFWTILWAVMIMSQVMQVSTNAWIKDWANSNKKVDVMLFQYGKEAADRLFAEMSKGHSTQWYLGIYLALSGAYLVTIAARVGTMYFGSLRAGRGLYSRLLTRILGAKMRSVIPPLISAGAYQLSFFDATPSGRITNRLSKDIATIDTETGECRQLPLMIER
jgi:ABC-type multidrug transport system fused ATPase/permease subunit